MCECMGFGMSVYEGWCVLGGGERLRGATFEFGWPSGLWGWQEAVLGREPGDADSRRGALAARVGLPGDAPFSRREDPQNRGDPWKRPGSWG